MAGRRTSRSDVVLWCAGDFVTWCGRAVVLSLFRAVGGRLGVKSELMVACVSSHTVVRD